jgi:hypothetical protein
MNVAYRGRGADPSCNNHIAGVVIAAGGQIL